MNIRVFVVFSWLFIVAGMQAGFMHPIYRNNTNIAHPNGTGIVLVTMMELFGAMTDSVAFNNEIIAPSDLALTSNNLITTSGCKAVEDFIKGQSKKDQRCFNKKSIPFSKNLIYPIEQLKRRKNQPNSRYHKKSHR